MTSQTTEWENEMYDALQEMFGEDDDVCVVLEGRNDPQEDKVCVKPLSLKAPSGFYSTGYFLVWKPQTLTCCYDMVVWAWEELPMVWEQFSYPWGWKCHAAHECRNCGAWVGPPCELINVGYETAAALDEVRAAVDEMRLD